MCSIDGGPAPLELVPEGSHVYDAEFYGTAASAASAYGASEQQHHQQAREHAAYADEHAYGNQVAIDKSTLVTLVSALASAQSQAIVVKPLTSTQKVHKIKLELPYTWQAGAGSAMKAPITVKPSPKTWKAALEKTGLDEKDALFVRQLEINGKSTTAKHDLALKIAGYDKSNPTKEIENVRRATDGFAYAAKIYGSQSVEYTTPEVVYHNSSDPSIVELHGDIDFEAEKKKLQTVTDMNGQVQSHGHIDSRSPFGQLCIAKAASVSDYENGGFQYLGEGSPMMVVNVAKALALIDLHKQLRQDVITMTRLSDLAFSLVRADVETKDITNFAVSQVAAAGLAPAIAKAHDDLQHRACLTVTLHVVESAKVAPGK